MTSEAARKALRETLYASTPFGETPSDNQVGRFIDRLADEGYYVAPIGQAGTTPASRTSDPRTSAAAIPTTARRGTQRERLLTAFAFIGAEGYTDEQAMEQAEGVSPLSEYAKRCSELREAGWIEDTGEDRKGATGTSRIVSRITAKGLAALEAS